MANDIDTVRVAVRIRPLVRSEEEKGCQEIVSRAGVDPQIVLKNNNGSFTFNHVYIPTDSQDYLFDTAVNGMLGKLFKGYNVTVLAYGQTGSGKTYTMGTSFDGMNSADMGVIPRAMFEIFNQVEKMSSNHQFTITCSFMELYQEQLFDLLSTSSREKSIVDIREDYNKGIIIPGLTEIQVTSAEETTNCLVKGSLGRSVGATAMNDQSSRSHAIFTVNIQMTRDNDSNTATTSKFHLVDLAGSERSKKTKATGDRFKEGVKINQGLLALGNVISALGGGQGNGFVGYRDSKLTRLLQDSLGGNSVTLMIACVSPADYNLDETLSTLRYADRARKIKNKPIVNQDPKTAEINRLNTIIQSLRLELLSSGGGSIVNGSDEHTRKQLNNLCEKNHMLQQQLQSALTDVAEIEMRVVVAETAHEKLQNKFEEVKTLVIELNEDFNEKSCSLESKEHAKKLDRIRSVVDEMNGIFRANNEEISTQKFSTSSLVHNNLTSSEMSSDDMQQKFEAFTSKQIDFNNELRRLNRELNLKEEHHQKVAGNLTSFCSYSDANIKECESKIHILEAEKSELLGKLKTFKDTASTKIAEDRRKRLQQLEVEINDLKKKNLQQAKLLKMREKESQKIINLNQEIVSMKNAKVKLIRQMKAENESFRQWKLNREKQLTQLKEKDRKRQNEMIRMESLYSKQKNVLKRKVEEAMAVNKRLKEVLDKQKTFHSNKTLPTSKLDQVNHMIDRELEVILSVIDAQYSLEQLMEDRGIINARLNELKQSDPNNLIEINAIKEDLEMRNAQIDDLQQKIIATDIEVKMKTICEGLHSMPEARIALKHLFSSIGDMRRKYVAKDVKIGELQATHDQADEKIKNLQKLVENCENQYRENVSNIEKNYEEKIIVLLKELNSNKLESLTEISPELTEHLKIQEETLDKIENLRDEVSKYQTLYYDLKNKRSLKKVHRFSHLQQDPDSEVSFLDDSTKDPDWSYKNEMTRTRAQNRRTTKNLSFEDKVKTDSSIDNDDAIVSKSKRPSEGSIRCNCKLPCDTRRCKCRSEIQTCSDKCGCPDTCVNNKLKASSSDDDCVHIISDTENKENSDVKMNHMHPPAAPIDENLLQTPIKKFKSSLSDTDSKILDVTTPSYPFSNKKRKPFYD